MCCCILTFERCVFRFERVLIDAFASLSMNGFTFKKNDHNVSFAVLDKLGRLAVHSCSALTSWGAEEIAERCLDLHGGTSALHTEGRKFLGRMKKLNSNNRRESFFSPSRVHHAAVTEVGTLSSCFLR